MSYVSLIPLIIKDLDSEAFIYMLRLAVNNIEVVSEVHGLISEKALNIKGWMLKIVIIRKDNIVIISVFSDEVANGQMVVLRRCK